MFGSDAQEYLAPASDSPAIQLPAIEQFMVCDRAFAEQAYEFGLRWQPLAPNSTVETDLEFALQRLGLVGGYWLRDIWSGRELFPDFSAFQAAHSAGGAVEWHAGLRPSADGSPPFAAVLSVHMIELREIARKRRLLARSSPESRPYLDTALPAIGLAPEVSSIASSAKSGRTSASLAPDCGSGDRPDSTSSLASPTGKSAAG